MSHIHLPDGVLPMWLWASGYVLAILISVILFRFEKKETLSKRLPLLGMMAAVMILGAAVEIIPPVYHVNLTVISGMLLGPSLIFLATFVVNVILALFGHGGVTVIGLNTLVLSIEGVLGYFFLHFFWKVLRRLTPASFLATFLALFISASSMIGVVSLGTSHYEELIHREEGAQMLELPWGTKKESHPAENTPHQEINLKRFIAVILLPGFLGWILEGVITALMVKYINRLRPDLLGLGIKSP
jgi:cobalt/nickel transport system permease protein